MTRRLPVLPTLLVAAAAATMVALGFWQLDRREWKEALIARYSQAQAMSADVSWPSSAGEYEGALYRHSSLECAEVTGMDAVAGRSELGRSGWAHIAHCRLPGGGEAGVAIGWSTHPAPPEWDGGQVAGFVAPAGEGVRLVASPPRAGLMQLAAPDPNDLPNNHLAYAVQWFFFALTALVIYALALRRRWREEERRA